MPHFLTYFKCGKIEDLRISNLNSFADEKDGMERNSAPKMDWTRICQQRGKQFSSTASSRLGDL